MAKRPAQSRERANQRTERDENAEINAAVAATETEVMDSVFDDEPLDLDGDDSLEEMGDDLEGEDDIREAEEDTDEGDGEGDDDGEVDDEGDLETGEGDVDDDEQQIAAQDRQQGRAPAIPPSRLREESERARAAEERARATEIELAEMRGRLDVLSRAPAQQQQREQPVVDNFPAEPPDVIVDGPGFNAWHAENNRRQIAAGIQEGLRSIRQESQTERETRANESFQAAATGDRSFEFHAAYDQLLKLPKNADSAKVANAIMSAPNQAEALFNWWEENGGPEYRESIAERLAEQLGWEMQDGGEQQRPAARQNGRQQQQPRQRERVAQPQGGQPRQVFRGPVRATRSLNDGGGGLRQQIDPRALDDSDAAVLDYVFEK